MTRFEKYRGGLSSEQFQSVMDKTQYSPRTKQDLRRFLVDGHPLSIHRRGRQQFLRNKMVDLEVRGLIK